MSSLCLSLFYPLVQLNDSRYLFISTGNDDRHIHKTPKKKKMHINLKLHELTRTECCLNGFGVSNLYKQPSGRCR